MANSGIPQKSTSSGPSDDESLLAQDAQMFELIEIVVPKMMAEWESVAYCMRYTTSEVTAFKKDAKDLKECCRNLFGNWLTTSHGPKPKTYQTLLKHIKKVYNLRTASGAIEKDLIEALSVGILSTGGGIYMPGEQTTADMNKTIASYQAALKEGSQPSNQFKLVAVGAEGAGKTSTVDTLFGLPFQPDQQTTVGASVNTCKVNRHLGSAKWEKVTASFRTSEIQKQRRGELKASMTPISVDPYLPTTQIPAELVQEVVDTVNSEDIQDGEIRSVVFDIGGQEIYYEIKFLFLAEEDIVMLCFDASVLLDKSVRTRSGRFEEKAAIRGMLSNIETIEVLLHSVYVRGREGPEGFMSLRIPLVLMVGTHAESLTVQDEHSIISKIKQKFAGKAFMDHLPTEESEAFHFITNSNPDTHRVNHLRFTIVEGTKPVTKVLRPISYLQFEQQILEEYKGRIERTKATEMARLAGIKGEEKVDALLQYFTNKGILLYYPKIESLKNEIFISPNEVSELVCTVITTESFKPSNALQFSYDRYNKHALLEESLFDFMLKKCGKYNDKGVILGLLQKFSIAAEVPPATTFPGEIRPSGKGKVLIIPSLLVYDETATYQKTKDDIVVVYHVPRGFLPETIFNKLLVETINWCREEGRSHKIHDIKRGIGYFLFDKGSWQRFQLQYSLSTHCIKCYITIYHTEHPSRDQLKILLQQRKNLLTHLNQSIAQICKSYLPSLELPVTCLECPYHESSNSPHIELNIDSNEELELVCDIVKVGCKVLTIPIEYYMLLFKPSLPPKQSDNPVQPTGDSIYHDKAYCFQPDYRVLSAIRTQFGKDWKYVGLDLELDNGLIKNIEHDEQDFEDRAFKMMSKWVKRNANSCYCQLISAMENQGLDSGAKVLKEKIKSSPKDSKRSK